MKMVKEITSASFRKMKKKNFSETEIELEEVKGHHFTSLPPEVTMSK